MAEFISFAAAGGGPVRVTTPSAAALLADAEACLAGGRGFALATINLDHLTKLRRDPHFADAYRRQTFVVADGNPIVWLSKLARRPVRLVPGSELVEPLVALAARTGAPLAMLGSTEDALAAAAAKLRSAHPGLEIAALISPPFGFDPEGEAADACLAQVAASGARLCLIALGAPKQEILAARGLDKVPGCGFASVGAGVDFIAGTQKRAPRWVQAVAMEWLWRLLSNPRRLMRRYGACAALLPQLALEVWRTRARG